MSAKTTHLKIEVIAPTSVTDVHIHLPSNRQDRLAKQRHAELVALINSTRIAIMAGIAELKQNMIDLRALAQQYLDLIIAKDAANAALQARIEDLVTQHVTDTTERAALLADIDTAVTDSEATEDLMRAGLPGVPPVGGTPLNPSYPDRASFDTAVAAYTGPEAVTLDGAVVKAGDASVAMLDYFTHSATGEINTTGPTD